MLLFSIQQNAQVQQNSKFKRIDYKHDQKEVEVSLQFDLQDYYVNPGDSLTLTPIIKSGARNLILPNIIMKGNDQLFYSSNNKDALKQKSATNIEYKVRVPYQRWMEDSELNLKTNLNRVSGAPLYDYVENIRSGINLPQNNFELLSNTPPALTIYDESLIKMKVFDLHYPSKTSLTVIDCPQLKGLKETMNWIMNNNEIMLVGIYVSATTSIDGIYADNEKLTTRQAETFKNYLQQYYNIPESYFHIKGNSEDWDGLAKQVEDSNMPYKQEVLDIMSKYGIFNGREKALMDLKGGSPYIYMKKNMFPKSQYVECRIVYRIK